MGKDTAAAILVEKYGFKRLAFADKLKEMALDIDPVVTYDLSWRRLTRVVSEDGWEAAKRNHEVRRFLQALGVAARDHLGPDVWVQPITRELNSSTVYARHVITDVRFPNEFAALAQYSDAVLLKLTRESAPSAGNHISETALADAEWDIIMGNNGTLEDLEANLVAALGLEAAA